MAVLAAVQLSLLAILACIGCGSPSSAAPTHDGGAAIERLPNETEAQGAIRALTGAPAQLLALVPGLTDAQAWHTLGATGAGAWDSATSRSTAP
jgi:hypothetical protein